MQVRRIVANLETPSPAAASAFYRDILGLDLLMDHGWIATYGSSQQMSVQVSFASEGGAGTPIRACQSKSMTSMKHTQPCAPLVSRFVMARPTSRGVYVASMFATPSEPW